MTKETVKEYLEEVNTKVWAKSPDMQEYCRKKCSDVFKSKKGYLLEFEKPVIKKNFCFGHGYNGISTQEEVNIACDNARNARTNENYFLEENLERYDEWLKILDSEQSLYLFTSYKKDANVKIVYLRTAEYLRIYPWDKDSIVQELDNEEIEELRQIVLSERAKFVKRLNTYLKKYGLSKINAWTYLVD